MVTQKKQKSGSTNEKMVKDKIILKTLLFFAVLVIVIWIVKVYF